jgi:cytochrome c553
MAWCFGISCIGCDTTSDRIRTWRASDHDAPVIANEGPNDTRPENNEAPRIEQNAPAPMGNGGIIPSPSMRVWAKNCMRCHGRIGKGDGPDGARLPMIDLTQSDWQTRTSNEAIVATIKNGKGMMPPFSLDDETINGLVDLIRKMGQMNSR